MALPRHRLPRWQRRGLYLSGALLLATGTVWLAVHYTIGAGAGELPHPLEAWCLRLHGLGAFAGLFIAGVLAAAHIPRGWRLLDMASSAPSAPPAAQPGANKAPHRARQRASGIGLCVLGAALVLTGYLLYYFAPEPWRPALGWLHTGVGMAMAALLLGHRRGLGTATANHRR
jgi:hypothetical protein